MWLWSEIGGVPNYRLRPQDWKSGDRLWVV